MHNTIDSLDPARWVATPRRPRAQKPSLLAALRAWLARRWPQRMQRAARRRDEDLIELDAHTLADIGAPDRLLARAMARRETQRQERDALHLGLASGAWHHW